MMGCFESKSVKVETKQVSHLDDDTEDFLPFIEFPTQLLLREANEHYNFIKSGPIRDPVDGHVLPCPAPSEKKDTFREDSYRHLDEYAVRAARLLPKGPLEDLVQYLTSKATDDVGKVRVIFRWLTAQQLTSLVPDTTQAEDTVHWYLSRLKDGHADYTELFLKMCSLAGIKGEPVCGYGKTANFKYGEENDLNECCCSWAAVFVDNAWRLINPHWGSVFVYGAQEDWQLIDHPEHQHVLTVKEAICNEFYFFTNADELIYKLIPKDERWQLLARPVTTAEFLEMAYLMQDFFQLELNILSHPKCNIYTEAGHVDIDIGLPEDSHISFAYNLWHCMKDQQHISEVGHIALERYIILKQNERRLRCSMDFPVAGKFKFELFAKDEDMHGIGNNDPNNGNCVCVYIIHCEKPKEDSNPLPRIGRSEWGPGLDLEKVGIIPVTHSDALVEAVGGEAELIFEMEEEVELSTELYSNSMKKEKLKNYTFIRKEEDCAVVELKIPESGQYALEINAKVAEETGPLKNVCTYLVSGDQQAEDPTPFPEELQTNNEAARRWAITKAERQKKERENRAQLMHKIKTDLESAIHTKNTKGIHDALRLVEKHCFQTRLEAEVDNAHRYLDSLTRMSRLNRSILELDTATISELARDSKPPLQVHKVMIAVLLILGDIESVTQNWEECRKRCKTVGPTSLFKRVTNFDVHFLHPEIAARARQILQRYRTAEISDTSAAAGAFYTWCVGLIEELRLLREDAVHAQPASMKRQKEIFDNKEKAKK